MEKLTNNCACDIIGLVTFVGRVERVKSKASKGKKCSYPFYSQLFIKTDGKLQNLLFDFNSVFGD